MRYDFDELTDRRQTLSLKWDVDPDEIPMWVADMDFTTAPCVREAIEKRAAHGIFGYSIVPDVWYGAYQAWWEKHHGLTIEKEWLIFTTGVIPAMSTAVRKFTTPAEKVLIQTPVYNIFFNSVINNGRRVLESPLICENGRYRMDLEDLEKKMSDPQCRMMLLCNPQNPGGEIWSADTLKRVGELALKHHVLVFSDEIHCDITAPGKEYVPYMSVSDECRNNCITAISPTKAFNIAGINTAAVAVCDEGLRQRMDRALNTDEVAEPGCFAVDAAVAAFSDEGYAWLSELRRYIQKNKETVRDYLKSELPEIKLFCTDATYLLWMDMSAHLDGTAENVREFQGFLRKEAGIYLSSGDIYGGNGASFMRMNAACPASRVSEGLERLKRGISMWTGR